MNATLIQGFINGLYLIAGILFILSLAGLSKQTTARAGNQAGMVGMVLGLSAVIIDSLHRSATALPGELSLIHIWRFRRDSLCEANVRAFHSHGSTPFESARRDPRRGCRSSIEARGNDRVASRKPLPRTGRRAGPGERWFCCLLSCRPGRAPDMQVREWPLLATPLPEAVGHRRRPRRAMSAR